MNLHQLLTKQGLNVKSFQMTSAIFHQLLYGLHLNNYRDVDHRLQGQYLAYDRLQLNYMYM